MGKNIDKLTAADIKHIAAEWEDAYENDARSDAFPLTVMTSIGYVEVHEDGDVIAFRVVIANVGWEE